MEARLTSVVVYPFKGAAGIAVDAAEIRVTGLATGGVADREWMAVDRDGRFVSQREFPRLALVRPAIEDGRLVLSAQGLAPLALAADAPAPAREVTVWNSQVRGFDAGDDAARWLSSAIASDVRIVRFDPATGRFESFPSDRPRANVRQMAGRAGEAWGAESGTDRLVVVPYGR